MSLPQMSVSGAVLIAVIAVVRALAIHRLPKRVFVLLWSVVLLRLLVPFSIPARMSVYSLVPEYMSADTVHRTDGVFVPAGCRRYPEKNLQQRTQASQKPGAGILYFRSVRLSGWRAQLQAPCISLSAMCAVGARLVCRCLSGTRLPRVG